MNTTNQTEDGETLKVPYDMAPDVLSIIVSERLSHEITGANPERNYFQVCINYSRNEAHGKTVLDEIKRLLEDYHYYRNASHDELNWI